MQNLNYNLVKLIVKLHCVCHFFSFLLEDGKHTKEGNIINLVLAISFEPFFFFFFFFFLEIRLWTRTLA